MTETTATRRSPKQWLVGRDRRELGAWLLLLAVAIVVRLIDLGDRPFHHDESQDAYFSYLFRENPEGYSYNPLLHGPLRFYMTGFVFLVFGDSDFTARLAPAVMGLMAVGGAYLLRHQLGRVGAFAAGIALAIGPTFLYFSRFAREDIYLAALTLAIIIGCFRFIERPRALTLSLVFGLASLAFAMKESGLVLCGFIALFFILAAIVQGINSWRGGDSFWDGEVVQACRKAGWMAWTYAVATLLVVYGAMFTVFFTDSTCYERNPDGTQGAETSCINAVYFGLKYWHDQQDVARGDDLASLYPSIMVGIETPIVILGLVGLYAAIRRPTLFRSFLIFYFVGVLGFHMWGSERFAWLVLHPLLPLILLAGVGVQFLWERRSTAGRVAAGVAVAACSAYLVWSSIDANVRRETDPRNMLVTTQTSPQARDVAKQILQLDRDFRRTHDGQGLTVSIDANEGATFPYAWYLRDMEPPAGYPNLAEDGATPTSQVLVLTEQAQANMLPSLAAYDGRKFDFRVWWIKRLPRKDNKGPYSTDLGDWWNYLTKRENWSPTGGMKQWFYVRRDAGALPGKGTKTQIPKPD